MQRPFVHHTSMNQYAGSKRKARQQARDERLARAMNARLRQIAELASQLDSDEQLESFLSQIEDDEVRTEVRTLILALRRPRIEVAAGPEDIRRAVANPSSNRTLVIPTAAGPLMVPS